MKFRMLMILCALAPAARAASMAHVGNAHYVFEDRAFASLFERTLVLGHTLSADFLIGTISKSKGPGTILAEVYAGHSVMANLAEPRAVSALAMKAGRETLDTLTRADCERDEPGRTAEKKHLCDIILNESRGAAWIRSVRARLPMSIPLEAGLDKIARLVYRIDDSSGPSHRLDFMDRVYEKATAIVALDAFYLSATTSFNSCDDYDVEDVIERFVTKTYADGKVTILGNVPLEDYRTFNLPFRLAVYPQIEECRQRINRALARACTAERGCYLVKMDEIVDELKCNGYLTLKDGTKLSRVQIRPDGLNLSNRGTQYVVEKILSQLRASPPAFSDRRDRPLP